MTVEKRKRHDRTCRKSQIANGSQFVLQNFGEHQHFEHQLMRNSGKIGRKELGIASPSEVSFLSPLSLLVQVPDDDPVDPAAEEG